MVDVEISRPAFCMTKREVIKMKAAQPFILMVVQMGRTKRETLGFALRFFSAEARVTGSVPAELLVKSATAMAGDIFLNTSKGLRPLAKRKSGSTIKNWMALLAMMTKVYFPKAPTMTPASICAESWAAKARMPTGRTVRSALIKVKSSSWKPWMPFRSVSLFSVRGMKARPKPKAAAMSITESTLPDRNGCSILFGTTFKI